MRSTANIKGHPLHPMLVAFPVAFLTGTFIFDIIGIFFDSKELFDAAYYHQIAGILGGLLAAVPGAIDLYTIVPPESSAYKRAIKHAVINILTLILFTAALFLKNAESNLYIVLLAEFAGLITLSAAGWLGGTLVNRNQIGVDHRYANAGKWNEERKEIVNGEVEAAALDELETDQLKLLLVKDKRIALGKTETGYYAFEDRCSHRGGPLSDGVMICGTVQCPWHGSQFDVTTGEVKAGPAKDKIRTYKTIERDNKIYIDLKNEKLN